MRRILALFLAVLLIGTAILAACSSPAPSTTGKPPPATTAAPAPVSTTAPAPATSTAAPATTAKPPAPSTTTTAPTAVPPAPIRLKLVTVLDKKSGEMLPVQPFVDEVAKRSNGRIIIDWVGGPEVTDMFQQAAAVRSGVIDMNGQILDFCESFLSESLGLAFADQWNNDMRKGFYDWYRPIWAQKMNVYFLDLFKMPAKAFVIVLNKEITKPQQLAGMKIRSEPKFETFFKALGATPVPLAINEVYQALGQKTVDASMTTPNTIGDSALYEVSKYVISEGFYFAPMAFLINLDVWNKIPKDQQDLLKQVAAELEPIGTANFDKLSQQKWNTALSKGMKPIQFSPEDTKWYLDTARTAGWDYLKLKVSADSYAKLESFLKK